MASGPTTIAGDMGAARALDLARLARAFSASSFATTTQTAAFQLAVWEIIYETAGTPYDVNSGVFKVLTAGDGTAARTQANTLLASLPGLTATAPLIALNSPTTQDWITVVPIPSSAVLLAGGLLFGLWGVRRTGAPAPASGRSC